MPDTPSPARLTDRELAAWRGLLRVHSEVVARLDAELERDQGIPLSAYEVLIYLGEAPDGRLRLGELASLLLLSRSGLTRLVDRLEREGLVRRERCEDDARGFFAALTPAGNRKLRSARPAHLAGVREHFLDHLSGPDLDALADAWSRILGQAEARDTAGQVRRTSA